jgi:hypothetical protein
MFVSYLVVKLEGPVGPQVALSFSWEIVSSYPTESTETVGLDEMSSA